MTHDPWQQRCEDAESLAVQLVRSQDQLLRQIKGLEDDLRQQCKLLSMSAERECSLHCKIDIAENYAKKMEAERDAAIRELGKTARDLGHLQAREDRMAELLREAKALLETMSDTDDNWHGKGPISTVNAIAAELAAHAKGKA